MLPVQSSHFATLIVLGTLSAGFDLFWFTKPATKKLVSAELNGEFFYCGRSAIERSAMRIINGVDTTKHEYPWIAKLLVDFMTVGAGSLITDRHILTAAHCLVFYNESAPLLPHCPGSGPSTNFEALPVSFFSFVLGSYLTINLPSDKILPAVSYVIHPYFDIFKSDQQVIQVNDIAIVTIKPVVFSHKILPICLPLPDDAIPDWWKVTVAGWGVISNSSGLVDETTNLRSIKLMKTTLTHIPFNFCKHQTNLYSFLTERNCISSEEREILCLYGDYTDSCRGDSGGPIMSKQYSNFYTVAGIVSWGIGCNKPGTPSASTNVRYYFHWILNNTREGFYLSRPPPEL